MASPLSQVSVHNVEQRIVRHTTRYIDSFALDPEHEMVRAVDRVPPPRPGVAPVELSAVGWHGGAEDVPGVVHRVDPGVDHYLLSFIDSDHAWNDIGHNSPLLGGLRPGIPSPRTPAL